MDPVETARLDEVESLIALSRDDWKFSDLYLERAEALLSAVVAPQEHRRHSDRRASVGRLSAALRRAIQRADWREAAQLAADGAELRRRVQASQGIWLLSEKVYGKHTVEASPTALALSGAVPQPGSIVERQVAGLCSRLRTLASRDSEERAFYLQRAQELESLSFELEEPPSVSIDPAELRAQALAAAEGADFDAVLRLARRASADRRDRNGRVRPPPPPESRADRLDEPLPTSAIEAAARLGLSPATLEPRPTSSAYLSCCCADSVTLPEKPLSEGRRGPETCTCGHACPPAIGKALKEGLDALMLHPFLTSGGTRYLPWFGSERILVETFPEEEPDAWSPILDALSLTRRQGITRLEIEEALLRHGPAVCRELGLDPVVYRVASIPFDAYQRLADLYGWGAERRWTHFDGYQVTRELRLQALVGGDVRFGGPDDLCGVGRAYDSDHLTARFAVVRRERFDIRAAEPSDRAEASA